MLRESANAAHVAPSAERDLRRDLPASCRRHALLCSAMHEDGTNGTPRVPHECRNHAEAVILVCWSISYTQLVVCYTFIGHAGGTTSTSPIQSFAGGPVSDLRTRIFGTTQLALDRTRHTTSYVIKNAVISSEKTRSRASAACERHAERPAWITTGFSRSVVCVGGQVPHSAPVHLLRTLTVLRDSISTHAYSVTRLAQFYAHLRCYETASRPRSPP